MTIPLTVDPLLPVEHIALAALAAAGLAVAAYARATPAARWQRALLLLLRLAAIAFLAVLLLRPIRPAPAPENARKPLFAILVDTSASMDTRDAGARSRYEAVVERLRTDARALFGGLGDACDVRVYEFDHALRAVRPRALAERAAPDGLRTDLAGALLAAARLEPGRPAAGALLISDGRDTAGGPVADATLALRARGMPVWTVCVGSAVDVKDVALTARLNQNFLFAGQPGQIHAILSQSSYDNWHVNVHLYREDRYVATRQAVLRRGTVRVEFPVVEEARGVYTYRLEVDPLPGEGDTRNNKRTIFARVVEEKTRILLVDAQPHWDSKFLLRVLQNDPNLDVTSVFYLTPEKTYAIRARPSGDTLEHERVEDSARMPRTREALYPYDCLILGRDMDRLLSRDEMRLLEDYLAERGGSIVFFRGRAYTGDSPLGAVEPVVWADDMLQDVRLELTPDGRISPIFSLHAGQPPDLVVRSLPGLTSVTRIEREKSLAVVLAVARQGDSPETMAALAYQRYGKGKVMTVSAAGLWRWAFMPARYDQYHDVYERFWRQIVQWLVFESDFLPGQDISFRTDSYTYQPGQRVQLSVTTRHLDPAAYRPEIALHPPEGPARTIVPAPLEADPSRFVATFTPEHEGEYRAVLRGNMGKPGIEETRFTVYSDLVEKRLVAADDELMESLATATGGEPLALDRLRELPAKVARAAREADARTKPVDAWDTLPVFFALAGLLAVEWFARRRWGLL